MSRIPGKNECYVITKTVLHTDTSPSAITHSTKNIAIELLCSCCTAVEVEVEVAVVEVVSFFNMVFTISDDSSCSSGIVVIFTSGSDDLMLKSLGAAEVVSQFTPYKMQSKITAVTLNEYIFWAFENAFQLAVTRE